MNDLIDKLPALKEAYPFKSHFCDLSYENGQSAKLHYLDEGTGPVILMLHGNPTWSFYFRNCAHSISFFHSIAIIKLLKPLPMPNNVAFSPTVNAPFSIACARVIGHETDPTFPKNSKVE